MLDISYHQNLMSIYMNDREVERCDCGGWAAPEFLTQASPQLGDRPSNHNWEPEPFLDLIKKI